MQTDTGRPNVEWALGPARGGAPEVFASMARSTCHCLVLAAIVLAALSPSPARACRVPVFRFALEQWRVDPYTFIASYNQAPSEEVEALLDELDHLDHLGLIGLIELDASGDPGPDERPDHRWISGDGRPRLVVLPPTPPGVEATPSPVFDGPLTRAAVAPLLASPMRREIARLLLEGESVVWLLLESGDAAADAKARATLERELADLADTLTLPPMDEASLAYLDPAAETKLKLSFAVRSLSRDDPHEKHLIALLLAHSPAAADKQPAAYAFFGRGRVLGPVVGEQINARRIEDDCVYLTGECACMVKRENPGWDMLMPVDWEGVLVGQVKLSEALPPVTMVEPVALDRLERAVEESATAKVAALDGASGGGWWVHALIGAGGALVLIVGAGTAVVLRRTKEQGGA